MNIKEISEFFKFHEIDSNSLEALLFMHMAEMKEYGHISKQQINQTIDIVTKDTSDALSIYLIHKKEQTKENTVEFRIFFNWAVNIYSFSKRTILVHIIEKLLKLFFKEEEDYINKFITYLTENQKLSEISRDTAKMSFELIRNQAICTINELQEKYFWPSIINEYIKSLGNN